MSHFSAQKEILKYKLDHLTFDLIEIDKFHNTAWSTVFSYMWVWIYMFLLWALIGVDIYTCLNILVFHRWGKEDYQPYAYSIAKWIFTGCIIFQFVLLLYHLIRAIHTYRTKNIALAYVNSITKTLYTVKLYNYHCLFHKIEQDNFFDWSAFLAYSEMDNALQILIADTPRQVINILTLRYYATDGDVSNDIIHNIKKIANTNLRLSIILSFMCLSIVIWSIFFFQFVLGMLFYIPVRVKVSKKGFKSLKKYCCSVVNDKVRSLVLKNHKPKNELIEQGILDLQQIRENPLLNSETVQDFTKEFAYAQYNDNKKLESYSLATLNDQETLNPTLNPFNSQSSLTKGYQNPFGEPSISSRADMRLNSSSHGLNDRNASVTSLQPENPFADLHSLTTYGERNHSLYSYKERNQSASSLTYGSRQNLLAKPESASLKSSTEPFTRRIDSRPENIAYHPAPLSAVPQSPLEPLSTPSPVETQSPIAPYPAREFESLDSESEDSEKQSKAPYPVRGISLFDKTRRRAPPDDDTDESPNGMYPLD